MNRRRRITKRSPITMNFFQSICADSNALSRYDAVRLAPSVNAQLAADDVAAKVVRLLDARPMFRGRASVQSGSTGPRGCRLKKPAWGDVDIVCFLGRDADGNPVDSFERFEKIRWGASKIVKEWLEAELAVNKQFDEQKVVDFYPGLVIKLSVKRNGIAHNPWFVDIIFAHDPTDANNNAPRWPVVARQLQDLSPGKRLLQTNSFAPQRDAFLKGRYAANARAKPLVRAFKAWNCILTKNDERGDCVNGFFFEILVFALLEMGVLPKKFDLAKALATGFYAVANPSEIPALFFDRELAGGDASDRPAPPDERQLAVLRKNAGPDALVLVDPFAPFSNVAHGRKKQKDAWVKVKTGAVRMLELLKSKNVTPYQFQRG